MVSVSYQVVSKWIHSLLTGVEVVRTRIFTEIKEFEFQHARSLSGAQAMCLIYTSRKREMGKLTTLVPANRASRGLDIKDVRLIIQHTSVQHCCLLGLYLSFYRCFHPCNLWFEFFFSFFI